MKNTIVILVLLCLGWFICSILAIITNSITLSLVGFSSLAILCLMMGANVNFDNNKPPDVQRTWKEKWAMMRPNQKRSYIMQRVAMPFLLLFLYLNYRILLNGYFGPFNLQQVFIYSFLILNLNLTLPCLIGMGVKKWIPRVAKQLRYT